MKKLFKSVLVALGTLPVAFLANDVMGASTSNEVAKRSTTTKQVQKNKVSTNASNAAQKTDFSVELLQQSRGIVQFQQGQSSGGQADVLVPFYGNNNEFLFTDIQAYQYGSQYQTLSGGLGARSLKAGAVYGLYGFYDFQTLNNNFTYHRYNIGAERFDGTWELRTNLYYYADAGIENVTDLGQTGAFIQGTNINYNHYYDVEQSYNLGGDLEVGRTLGLEALRGYVAYYNYGNEISGGRVRASYDFGERWQLIGSGQYDAARGWLAYGGVNYWIGKARPHTGTAIDHIRDPIVRDMTIGVKKINSYNEPDLDPRNIYFASPTGSATATGAQNDPLTIDAAISKADAGDFIYLENGTYTLDKVITLKADQTLWGTGANLPITSSLGNAFTLVNGISGTSPVLNASGTLTGLCGLTLTSCAIYVGQTTQYGGFTLDGGNGATHNGFYIGGTSSITANISDITVQSFADKSFAAGINVNNKTSIVSLTNVSANSNANGLFIQAGQATIAGLNNYFNNNVGYGIQMTSAGSLLTEFADSDLNINGNSAGGLIAKLGSNVTLKKATISQAGAFNAINVDSGASFVGDNLIVSITDSGGYALLVDVATATLTNSSLTSSIDLGQVVQAQNGGNITLNSPTALIGSIYTLDGTDTIKVNYANGDSITVTNGGSAACNIVDSMGKCTQNI